MAEKSQDVPTPSVSKNDHVEQAVIDLNARLSAPQAERLDPSCAVADSSNKTKSLSKMAKKSHIAETSQNVPTPHVSKNDLGETGEQDLSARLSVSQAERLDPEFAATKPDMQRVIDVMDHFLCCEATWIGGADSKETVFSCIYFRDPSRSSSHALLRSFFGVARMTYKAVSSVQVFEKLDEDFSDGVSLQMLQGVEEEISRQFKARKALLSKKRLSEGVEPLQTNTDPEEEFRKAVLCRVGFRKYFYHMLASLRRTKRKDLDLCTKHIASCLNELKSMLKSEEFLRSQTVSEDTVEHRKTTASGAQPHSDTVELHSWKEAIKYYQKLLHDLRIICSHSLTPVLEDALNFVVDFHKFQPLPFARASIQMLVQDGRLYGLEPIFVIIRKAALLPKRANEHNIKKLKSVKELGQLLIKLLRVLCTDFESQRRALASVILDWRRILQQLKTDFRDVYGNYRRFSSDQYKINDQVCKAILLWAEELDLWIASRYLLLGFDTNAYSPNDYCMNYWYIYMIFRDLEATIMLKIAMKIESMKKARTRRGGSANDMDEESVVTPQLLLVRCYMRVAEGLVMILGFLRAKHNLFIGQNEEQRFGLYFFAFKEDKGYWRNISYEGFKECTSPSRFSNRDVAVYGKSFYRVGRLVPQLRAKYANDATRLAEVQQLANVSVRNEVTFSILGLPGTLDRAIYLEFNQHPQLGVATISGVDFSKFLRS